jgi:hypothetical protein
MRLNDIPMKNEGVTLLLYGNSGTGKTFFVGSAGDRTLIISPSNGLATLKSKLFKDTFKSNPFIEEIPEEVFSELKGGAKSYDLYSDIIERYLDNHKDEIDTIVVDDATAFRRYAMNKALEMGGKMGTSKTGDKLRSNKMEIVVPAVQDYGMEMNFVEQFIRFWCDECKNMGKNFILTAHEKILYEKGDAIGDLPVVRKIMPGFTGQKFPDDITGLFDLTWHTETKGSGDKVYYQIRTQPDNVIVAKTRQGGLFPAFFEKQPTFVDVVNAVKTQTPLVRK